MICQKCGTKLKEGAAFCQKCGTPVAQQPSQPTFTVNSSTKQEDQPTPVITFNNNIDNSNNVVQKPKKKGKKKIVIIILICLILILVAAGVAYYFLVYKDSETVSEGGKVDANSSNISQIETSAFPDVTLYVNVKDNNDKLNSSDFKIVETDNSGNQKESSCKSISAQTDSDNLYINLVIGASKSMSLNNQLGNAKTTANKFVDEASGKKNTYEEITAYNDKVFNKQPFSNNTTLLHSSINSLAPIGESTFYDALYWALQRTSLKSGCRYVVVFTDGKDTASKYPENDVIELSKKTGIPVYVIGVGEPESDKLEKLAKSCKGDYYNCSGDNTEKSLNDSINTIYNSEKSLQKFVFTSALTENKKDYRKAQIQHSDGSMFCPDCAYTAENDVSPYENKSVDKDYVLPETNTKYYTEAELQNMSIWDLYLARNEIYARHGRDFKHQDLKDYFATKTWYKVQYSPEQFDAIQSTVFNDFERKNADLMLQIEKSRNSPYLAP